MNCWKARCGGLIEQEGGKANLGMNYKAGYTSGVQFCAVFVFSKDPYGRCFGIDRLGIKNDGHIV